MTLLEIFQFLVLITNHHIMLIITKITFKCKVMVQSMVLMEALVRQRKKLILTLAEQGQIFP